MAYDKAGRRASVTDPVGNVTSWAYDDAGRVTAEADPLGKATTYAYDKASRLVSVTDRMGRRRAFGYDTAGRKTSESWYSAANALVQTQTFGYDAAGNQTSAADPDGSYAISYDGLNRASVVAGPLGFTQAFAYDTAGNRVSVADSKGGATASTFDLADRLTSRSFADGTHQARLDYAYTDRGELKAVTRYADTAGTAKVGSSAYAYDDGGRVTAITHADGAGAVLADYAYAYDAADRLTQKTEGGVVTAYGYDKAGQLVQDGATVYAYDKAGNRTAAGYTTAAGNRVTAGGGWDYTYDAAGQVASKSKAGEYWAYGYDHRGQLVSAAKSASAGGAVTDAVAYQYDAWGNLVGRTQTGSAPASERYAVDGWDTAKPDAVGAENFDAVADLDAGGNVTARRVFGAGFDMLGVRVDGGGDAWYLADRQGSVRAVAGPGGAVTGTRNYDAFGATTAQSGSGLDRYAYTGRELDGLTGQAYVRGRWADPGAGRFTTEDPARWAAGDPNLYRYAGNSPTNATDPSGQTLYIPDDPMQRAFWQEALGGNVTFRPAGNGRLALDILPGARTNAVHEAVVNRLRALGIDEKNGLAEYMSALYGGDLTKPANPDGDLGTGNRHLDLANRIILLQLALLEVRVTELVVARRKLAAADFCGPPSPCEDVELKEVTDSYVAVLAVALDRGLIPASGGSGGGVEVVRGSALLDLNAQVARMREAQAERERQNAAVVAELAALVREGKAHRIGQRVYFADVVGTEVVYFIYEVNGSRATLLRSGVVPNPTNADPFTLVRGHQTQQAARLRIDAFDTEPQVTSAADAAERWTLFYSMAPFGSMWLSIADGNATEASISGGTDVITSLTGPAGVVWKGARTVRNLHRVGAGANAAVGAYRGCQAAGAFGGGENAKGAFYTGEAVLRIFFAGLSVRAARSIGKFGNSPGTTSRVTVHTPPGSS